MTTEYGKIDTLFERNPETFVVDPTKLKKPVFGTIREWDVTEKVDGTNIRIIYNPSTLINECVLDGEVILKETPPSVTIGGRTDNAQIPGDLVNYLTKTFTPELFAQHFQTPVVLYGEGYGAGIQKVGKLYRPDKSFILFDILVDNQWWSDAKQVQEVGAQLGIPVVPYLGLMTLPQIVTLVREGITSKLGNRDFISEGIVARPVETLFDKRHERVILKLKTKDFVSGKR